MSLLLFSSLLFASLLLLFLLFLFIVLVCLLWLRCAAVIVVVVVLLVAVVGRDRPHLPKYSTRPPALTRAWKAVGRGGGARHDAQCANFLLFYMEFPRHWRLMTDVCHFVCRPATGSIHAMPRPQQQQQFWWEKNVHYDAFACHSGHVFADKVYPRLIYIHA